jgi:flagellar biosynthesis protein FlhB
MSSDGGEKKFELSAKRREELRREGQIPRSQDISTVAILTVGFGGLLWGGGMLIGDLRETMVKSFTQAGQGGLGLTPAMVGSVFSTGVWIWLAAFLGAIALAVVVSQVAQVGFNMPDNALELKAEYLNPVEGAKRLFSLNRVLQTVQSLLKLAVVAIFAWMAIRGIQDSAVFLRPVNLQELGTIYIDVAWSLGWRIIMALALLSGTDYLWQWWKFNRDHRMTFEEVKEERRSMEASPEVIKKRRMMARKVSMRRMLEDMTDATIVVTNPTHYAVALKYRKGETEAPVIVAKGTRRGALRIKQHAYDLRIAVRENKPLARGLYKHGRVGQPIPPIFYQGVAVILATLYRQGFRPSDYEGQVRPGEADTENDEIWKVEND